MFDRTSVGLDIGSKWIKLVAVGRSGDGGQLKTFGQTETPEGLVENGLVNDPETVGAELGKLVEQLKLKGKKTISALSGQQVYTRLMTLPAMPIEDMRTAALYQSTSFLPISVDDVTSDILPVRQLEDQEGKKEEVFFVAARKTQVENLLKTCQIGGLNLTTVEIEALALNTLYKSYFISDKVYGIINIGAQRSYLSVFQDQTLVFNRAIGFGCSAFYDQIPKLAGNEISLEELDAEEHECQGILGELIDELARSLDYFRLQNSKDQINNMLICGGCARLGGIEPYLSRVLDMKVQVGNVEPLIKLPGNVSEAERTELRFEYPIALGLALRGGK